MEKLTLVKKAYTVWHDGMINENPHLGFRIDEIPAIFAETQNKAKGLSDVLCDYEINGEPHKFTDIKVRRARMDDIVLYGGNKYSRGSIEGLLRKNQRTQERADKINTYPDGTNFYIQNGFVGNSVLWWGLKSSGYTSDISKAQLYTKQEVLDRFVNGRDEDIIWPAAHVLENVKQHVDGQYLDRRHKS